mmetsp:Transcript_14841/g.38493  ORF Transcript_14841/g.38493 Transcript_14841/m.38493 type:complete len:134 (+) Transcript_14841:729-1130(+)
MFRAVAPRLLGVSEHITQVRLPDPPSGGEGAAPGSEGTAAVALPLRTEPQEGCVTTMEAVARALRVLERARGEEVMAAIMAPLEHLVRFQAQFDPAIRARLEGGELVKSTKQSHRRQRPRQVEAVPRQGRGTP